MINTLRLDKILLITIIKQLDANLNVNFVKENVNWAIIMLLRYSINAMKLVIS
jgi:hypothetical protein